MANPPLDKEPGHPEAEARRRPTGLEGHGEPHLALHAREVVSRLVKDFERQGLAFLSRNSIELKNL